MQINNRARGNLLLLLAGLLSVALVIAVNLEWYKDLWGYWNDCRRQVFRPGLEQRKAERLGNMYTLSKAIALALRKERQKEKVVVLLPPTPYFRKKGLNYHVPEPAVFYYYTGMKTVWPDTKDTAAITHVVEMKRRALVIRRIRNREQLSAVLAEFRKYKITL
ncbi:hypothetical protein [Chitinophaga japonensis]|uniref:Uncharacterized protein n=1 Tax=Chitinophaga japonensis TaxID=104662 RepID=A0A562SI26_CHIJA|nr:hypothetical protein [Chitinophaga japonensis]TWI80912.1 hypothetical protein LX66_5517 [Chitinophaga japonensis]